MWEDDSIQFPRLLAEINAVGLSENQCHELEESMDLPKGLIDELLARAERQWRRIKSKVLNKTEGKPSRVITTKLKDQLPRKSNPPIREVRIDINEDGILFEMPGVTPKGTILVDVLQGKLKLRLSAWDKAILDLDRS